MMTVAEMIADLAKLPSDARVMIEGYMKGTEDCNGLLNPECVEGLKGGDPEEVRAVIFASIVTDQERHQL